MGLNGRDISEQLELASSGGGLRNSMLLDEVGVTERGTRGDSPFDNSAGHAINREAIEEGGGRARGEDKE